MVFYNSYDVILIITLSQQTAEQRCQHEKKAQKYKEDKNKIIQQDMTPGS